MPLYGAEELAFPRFDGGLVRDADATELDADQASDAANVDFRDLGLSMRRGRVAYNAAAPVASKVWGLYPYYGRTGTRSLLLAAGTKLYGDLNSDGDFGDGGEELATGLNGGAPVDFAQYREVLYIGSAADPLLRWGGSSTATAVALLAAPSVPTVTPYVLVAENFDSATKHGSDLTAGWVRTDTGNSDCAAVTDDKLEGTGAVAFTFSTGSKGDSFTKRWSSALTVDLSQAEALVVWYQGNKAGATFKVGVIKNGATTVDFSLFGQFVTVKSDEWTAIRVPLDAIAPADRSASPGLGIQLLTPGSGGFNIVLTFDQCVVEGPLPEDRYTYYTTGVDTERTNNVDIPVRESNPSAAVVHQIQPLGQDAPPAYGVFVTPAGAPAGADLFRIYRYRDHGTFRRARLIGAAPASFSNFTKIDGAINASVTSVLVDSTVGVTRGAVLLIDSEKLLVTAVSGLTLTVTRAFEGTAAASHLDNADITWVKLLDTRSDGDIALEDPDELVEGQINPPLAATYALVNARLLAGNVTIAGTAYPWRLYLSRLGFPEQFSEILLPDKGPNEPGWLDIPTKDHIRRIVEFDGQALIFCDRSVWALEGSGWDDFALRKRADVGLDAREAVVITDRRIYFLAADGVRVLLPNSGAFEGSFETHPISEPVDSLLRAIPAAYRGSAAMGVDERGRVHLSFTRSGQTVNDAALVFDPYLPGALDGAQYNPLRRGWTYYTNWGFSCFARLKRGGSDAGQLLGGDPAAGRAHWLQRSSADADLLTDDGSAIAWYWQSKAFYAGPGAVFNWSFIQGEFDAAANQTVTATPILNGAASATTYSLSLGAGSAGFVVDTKRTGAAIRGRYAALKLSGSHSVAMRARGARIGAHVGAG